MPLSPEKIIGTICPALSGSPSLPVFLEMAAAVASRGFFGSVYNQAAAYQAAHLFTMMGSSGGGGAADAIKELGGGAAVASMSEGGLSVSFAQTAGNSSGTAAALGSTKYGRMYLGLMKSRPTMGVNHAGGLLR